MCQSAWPTTERKQEIDHRILCRGADEVEGSTQWYGFQSRIVLNAWISVERHANETRSPRSSVAKKSEELNIPRRSTAARAWRDEMFGGGGGVCAGNSRVTQRPDLMFATKKMALRTWLSWLKLNTGQASSKQPPGPSLFTRTFAPSSR